MRTRAEHDERLTVDVATLQAHCATYGNTLTGYCRPVGAPRRAMAYGFYRCDGIYWLTMKQGIRTSRCLSLIHI